MSDNVLRLFKGGGKPKRPRKGLAGFVRDVADSYAHQTDSKPDGVIIITLQKGTTSKASWMLRPSARCVGPCRQRLAEDAARLALGAQAAHGAATHAELAGGAPLGVAELE